MAQGLTRLGRSAAVMLCSVVSAGAGDLTIVDGVPPGYEVVRLTDELVQSTIPVINDESEVVWGTRIGDTISNVHRFSEGLITTLTDDQTLDTWPTINNASEMVWIRCPPPLDPPCEAIATFSEEPIHGDFPVNSGGAVEMNDAGDAVWTYVIGDEDLHKEVVLYRRDEGFSEIITDVGLNNQSARINDARQITWTRYDFSVGPWESTIMFWSDGVAIPLSSGTSQAQGPDLNDRGQVIWRDGVEIFLWEDGEITNLTAQLEPSAIQPRINNSGDIFFELWNAELAKWDACLAKGENLYRLPDFGLTAAQGSLSERGELAWRVGLPGPYSNVLLLRRIAPAGDMNHDCHLDLIDLRVMQICFTGSDNGPPGGLLAQCARADFDEDGDIDAGDFEAYLDVQTGPAVAVPDCDP